MIDVSSIIRKYRSQQSPKKTCRAKYHHEESEIQQSCVRWFRYAYPRYLIFSVPNGGSRNVREAVSMKAEGTLAGVSDLIVVAERRVLFVEMKREKGRQQKTQVDFQHRVEALGHCYVLCRSLDDFMQKVNAWISPKQKGINDSKE